MKKPLCPKSTFFFVFILIQFSCKNKTQVASNDPVIEMELKRGEIISCGPTDQKLGMLDFETSCSAKTKEDFNVAVKLLHSFEYDESEKVFAKIIDEDPSCAMAYWGVAMSNFHPLWAPPTEPELKKGSKALAIAAKLTGKSKKTTDYLHSISAFYTDWDKFDHLTRASRFETAMEKLYSTYPDDDEAAVFYALSLTAAADPADKTYTKQKKAGAILNQLVTEKPDHPGIVHYIIHTYDRPELAALGLAAAQKYADLAPSSAHALHMPSHIFTRLGLWEESIRSNLRSVESAKCYAEQAGIKGHWDEELHGLDYLVYAYLQMGNNDSAKKYWDYLNTINVVQPTNFKVSYAFASIPSRYLLENKRWAEAALIQMHPTGLAWKEYPWQEAIVHFAKSIGAARSGDLRKAETELDQLKQMHSKLVELKDNYKANQVMIQLKAAEAWVRFKQGKPAEALALMNVAADMEDKTEKHAVTPCEVFPARELLGDMLLEMNEPAKALVAYEADLKKHPNRFNGMLGAGTAAEKSGDHEKALKHYRQLLTVSTKDSKRPELQAIRAYIAKNESTHLSKR